MSTSRALAPFGTSVFSVYSALARAAGAVDLGQGFPDFDGPAWVRDAAAAAIAAGRNQYAPSPGVPRLRAAIAADSAARLGLPYDADREVTVTTGATEGIAAALLGHLDPGDEVLAFEPFYDSYPACAAMAGARLRAVPLRAPGFRFDRAEVAAAFGPRTRAFLLNTPHNPTGRVFDADECAFLADLCRRHDCLLVTDEVYEHLTFPPHAHVTPGTIARDRVIRISSAAKTFSLTGWKVGWVCAPEELTEGVRRAHQFLVFCAAAPLQEAIATALEEAPRRGYYETFRAGYAERRALLLDGLAAAGFSPTPPEGSYFVMASHDDAEDGDAFVRRLLAERGVGAIPPRSFYEHAEHARGLIRFAFCKTTETLRAAVGRLTGA